MANYTKTTIGKEIVYGNGTWKPDSWSYMIYHDSWKSMPGHSKNN